MLKRNLQQLQLKVSQNQYSQPECVHHWNPCHPQTSWTWSPANTRISGITCMCVCTCLGFPLSTCACDDKEVFNCNIFNKALFFYGTCAASAPRLSLACVGQHFWYWYILKSRHVWPSSAEGCIYSLKNENALIFCCAGVLLLLILLHDIQACQSESWILLHLARSKLHLKLKTRGCYLSHVCLREKNPSRFICPTFMLPSSAWAPHEHTPK